jgi:HEAT repeat protein
MSARYCSWSSQWIGLGMLWVISLALGVPPAKADQSQFINAKMESQDASQGLEAAVQRIAADSQRPLWLSYQVDAVGGKHSTSCCDYRTDANSSYCGICNLENGHGQVTIQRSQNQNTTIKLEQLAQVTVLLRVEQKHVMRIREASPDCELDAGGLQVVYLTGVQPAQSVALLAGYVSENGQERDGLSNEALVAIAQHADSSADRVLADFVAPNQPTWLREKASFWLGAARGKSGLQLLEKMAKSDPSGGIREKVAFAMFVSHEPEAVDDMIRMAKDDPEGHVRGQALFWLAQKAGQKASAAITGAIQNDPDTEVKKKAVFALTQMPKDEGVPKLIEVAQNNKNPEVRKQAMFWLGQSNDPRALAYFEKILSQ